MWGTVGHVGTIGLERDVLIQGRCHCGNVTFTLAWEPDPSEIPARACGCTFCVKHGGVWTSNPRGSLRVTLNERGTVTSPR
jgi:hypothetical protein